MSWPPTKLETLRSIAQSTQNLIAYKDEGGTVLARDMRDGDGLFICDPQYLLPLEQDGLIERVDFSHGHLLSGQTSRLTDKGREAIQMLDGHRAISKYAMPGWVLHELTK